MHLAHSSYEVVGTTCSDDESEAMKELINRGCDITIQIVADDPKTDVARLLK